jgi:simple sugar transport system permease protein
MKPFLRKHFSLLATVSVLLVLYVAASITYDGFFSWYQFTNLFGDNATLGLAAIGMTFVILSGGIDLSVGAMIALTSMLVAKCVAVWGIPPPLAIPLVLLAGIAFGTGQGCVIHAFRLPPFLVTLAGMFLARGLALVLTVEKRITLSDNTAYRALADVYIFGWTLPAIVFVLTLIAAMYVAKFTRFGRAVYAIGGKEASALLMGLPVASTKIRVYAASGLCASLAGVVHTIGSSAGDASVAYMLELDAIAAVVIGGTLLSGGVGSVFGTLIGVLISGIITVVPTYQGNLNSWWTKIAIGLLLLTFILLQRVLHLRSEKHTGP